MVVVSCLLFAPLVARKMKPAKPAEPILVCLFVFMCVIDFHLWSMSCCFCFQISIGNLQKKTSVHGLQTNMCVCMCRCTWTCLCVCACACACMHAAYICVAVDVFAYCLKVHCALNRTYTSLSVCMQPHHPDLKLFLR